jgi:aspartate racemase
MPSRWRRVIGIVGGLGPHAHIELERRLLAAVETPSGDQDYPEWVVSSIPATPDRTEALLGRGASPVPSLVRSLETLQGRADFAVIACITAHEFLDQVRARVRIPILDLVAATLEVAEQSLGDRARIGLLATTGTLQSGLFPRVAQRVAPRLELVSLPDLPGGWELQEELLMRPIYGPLDAARRIGGGVKSGSDRDPLTGIPHAGSLARAAGLLREAGAAAVITGCTEVSLVLGAIPVAGIPLLDPMEVAARTAIAVARGDLPLPS